MSVLGGVAPPPGRWGETQPLRLRRLDQPSRPRRLLAEEFFAGPIAPAGGPSPLAHRWASGLAAAALSLTLVLSMVALALLGGGGEPAGRFSQAPLLAEGRGEPIRAVPAPPPQEPAEITATPTEPAVVAPPAEVPAPVPAPVVEEPVADEGAEGSGGTVPAGGPGGDRGGAGGGGGGDDSGGGGGGDGTNVEVVPPTETGGDVVGIQPIAPVPTETGEDDADTTPGSEGEAQEEEPQPPPEELPPCCINEEEENGSDDEGMDSADEDDADQNESDGDEGSQENGSAGEEDLS